MKNIQKRSLSLLVVFALCLSFIVPAVQLPAAAAGTVDYEYSGNYVYNWGARDDTATFLSPMAEAFYTGSNTYAAWAQLPGGATTADVPGSELYNALGAFMMGKHTNKTSYDATRDLYQLTDCEDNGATDSISSFYSGAAIGPDWDSGKTWNREHVWPNSKSASGSDRRTTRENDIIMLRPTAKDENGDRGNTAYGESGNYYDPDQLGQNVRGDVARVALYVYTRWGYDTANADGALDYMWGSSGIIESLDVLLDWMVKDPVDTWEMGRNDACQSITGTRNVFVDYPQLAFHLFGKDVPANLQTPSGERYATVTPGAGTTPPTTDSETPGTSGGITMIDKIANLTAGTYKMAGYSTSYQTNDWSANPYHLWDGTVNSGDLVTNTYSFADGTLTASTTDAAADMELVAVSGKANTYYVKVGEQYLYSTASATNRKLALSADPAEWVASDNAKGGITLSSNSVYLGTAGAASKLLRSYKGESTLQYGVVFFTTSGSGEQPPVNPEPDTPTYPDADTTLTIPEAITLGESMTSGSTTPGKYYVTGVITEVYNTQYGNMYIKDDAGNRLTIYGTYSADGSTRYDALATKPVANDTVTMYGVIGNYNGSAQMVDGWIIAHTPATTPDPEPENPTPDEPGETSGYTLIDTIADLTAGTYKMAGYSTSYQTNDWSANPYHVWDGTVNAGDLVTNTYAFANGALTASATDAAADVQLVAVSGKANTYYIQVGDQYLYSTASATNRKLALSADPAEWVASDNAKGGITLSSNSVYLGTAGAASKLLRSYKGESTLQYGVVFFAGSAAETPDPEQPPVTPDPEDPTEVTELQTGDQVVIFAPAYNKAFSSQVVSGTYYQQGVDVTVADGAVTGYGATEIWTVTNNGDGTYSFAYGGQNIAMGTGYSSMTLGEVNDDWQLISLGGTLYNVRNTARQNYMEWYASKNNWSTYNFSGAATDGQYQLSFYVVDKGILTAGGTTPEPEPEPEYPEADTTLTIQEAIALGTPMSHNTYTPGKYYVTGVITEVYNTQYGNMYIKDDAGNVLTVYGTYSADGNTRYDALETKPVAGDQITVYGVIGNYSSKPQMKNGWITAHTPGVEEPPAEPVEPEFPVSDKIVGSVADLLPGTYKLAAYLWKDSDGTDISAAPFHLWNGTVNSGDLVTSSYAFAGDNWTAAATNDAADVVLVAVPGKADTYYIMVGDQYLYSTASENRSLALGADPAEWVATDNEKGGISLSSNGVYLGSANAKSKFLRSYANESTLVSGVYFFAVNVPKPADPIALKSMNMQLGSSMSLNLNGLASVLDQYENVYVIYQPEGGEPVKVTQYFESTNENDKTLRYNFAYEGLTIQDLNLNISYTIYGTFNGKEYHSETKSTSLLNYCRSCLKSYNAATVPCANLIKYAMAAEDYVKEDRPETDDSKFLVNVLTDTEMAQVEQYAYTDDQLNVNKTSVVSNGATVKFRSQALNMLSRITMLYKMEIPTTVDTSKLTFQVTYTNVYGQEDSKDYTFEDLEYETETGFYVLSFSEFHATQMREKAKCTIYIDGVEHASYENSIENYCYTAVNSASLSEKEKHLATRISLYGDACYAAFNTQ